MNKLGYLSEVFTEEELSGIKEVLLSYRLIIKKEKDWKTLFGKMTVQQMVNDINNRWLDPKYKLVVTTTHKVDIVPVNEVRVFFVGT